MKPEEQITFVAELLYLINELQELVKDHCRMLTSEQDEHMLKSTSEHGEPF